MYRNFLSKISRLRRFIAEASPRVQLSIGAGAVVIVLALGLVLRSSGTSLFSSKGDAEKTLAADDQKGSPHVVLPKELDPGTNTKRTVPKNMSADHSKILTVKSAELVDGSGPYNLVWTITGKDDKEFKCINCAFVDDRVKKIIAAVVATDNASDIDHIEGLDPSRTLAGDYIGNGWGAQIVVGVTAKGFKAGEAISQWLIDNSKANSVFSVLWQNMMYTAGECKKDLSTSAPVEAYHTAIGSSAANRADAGIDRVIFSSPSYSPVFEDRSGTQFISGWKPTSC
jgi:hypothetical protein